ncbi:hypothetical protein GALMADRAFT_296299 [Galerina marginata CBS 339.88]|uniref:C2 domain-containing protein n=1 Tax=Galerina marginata (strain CBS 339.88) TaxID=685588 RepID=A0A067TNU8_GALM3|nr:hypothetical protein GALMADRAFT_296299 [Galerina marginata CBS 339.88]
MNTVLACFGRSPRLYESISSNVISHQTVIGVVRVVVQAANIRKGFLKPRPSVLIRVQGRADTQTTTRENKTHSPNWFAESTYVLVYSLQDSLEFEILNHHRIIRTGLIGQATFPLSLLDDDPRRTGEEVPIIKNSNKANGTLLFNIFYYPVSVSKEISSSSYTGVITLFIWQAKGFNWESYSKKPRKIIVMTSLGWTDGPIHETHPCDLSEVAVWNSSYDFLCFDRTSTTVVMKIVDLDQDKNLIVHGHISLALDELILAQDEKRDWWSLSGRPDGQLRVTAEWRPIGMNRNSIYM